MIPRLAPYAWAGRASCDGTNPDYWDLDVQSTVPRFARDLCLACPVLLQCALSAKQDKANGVIRAATECRRTDRAQREATDEALDRVALAARIADGAR